MAMLVEPTHSGYIQNPKNLLTHAGIHILLLSSSVTIASISVKREIFITGNVKATKVTAKDNCTVVSTVIQEGLTHSGFTLNLKVCVMLSGTLTCKHSSFVTTVSTLGKKMISSIGNAKVTEKL